MTLSINNISLPELSTIILTNRLDERLQRAIASVSTFSHVYVGISTPNEIPAWLQNLATKNVELIKLPSVTSFAQSKNDLLKKVKTKWTLSIDSDEEIDGELANEILSKLMSDKYDGYKIKRTDIWHHQPIKFGEAGHTNLLRLFKTKEAKWARPVHETVILTQSKKCGQLKGTIKHYPHPTLNIFLQQVFAYAQMDAHYRFKQGERFSYWELAKPIGKFLYNYFWLQGWRDGHAGLTYAVVMSLHSLMVRISLYELAHQN